MPKIKPSYCSKKPPIDWLWAAVLERKIVFGYDLKMMAKAGGVSYDTMRRYIRVSPWEWSASVRKRICDEFGISTKVSVGLADMPEQNKARRERV